MTSVTSVADEASEPEPLDPDEVWTARVAALGIIGFTVAWVVVMFLAERGLYGAPDRALQVDLYRTYAQNVLNGQVPYRDFSFEYPPLALVPIVAPLLFAGSPVTEEGYRVAFELFMAGIGMVTMIFVMRAAAALHLGRRDMLAAAALVAASPVLLGPLMLARYDLWPGLFTAAAMWALVTGHGRLTAIALGLAVLAKVYPIVLAPLVAVYLWRQLGPRRAIEFGLILVTTVYVGVAPFYWLAPNGIVGSMTRAFTRPLQVESIGASFMYLASVTSNLHLTVIHTFDSYNLSGNLASQIATIQTAVLAAVVALMAVLLLRGRLTIDRLVIASAAALTAYVAFGKVFSPQYLMWLIAPHVIVRSRGWPVHLLAIGVAILLTGWYYPRWYNGYYILHEPLWVAVVLARNLVLAALTGYLVVRLVPPGQAAAAGANDDGRVGAAPPGPAARSFESR